jgi:DNA-directed RNA polymerase subunit F
MKPTVIKETPMSMSEVKSELSKIKKRDEELNFRSAKTEEYLNQFSPLSSTKVEELKKKLEGLKIPRLKEEHVVKIVDVLPSTLDDVKAFLQGQTITVTQENQKKIADTVDKFLK